MKKIVLVFVLAFIMSCKPCDCIKESPIIPPPTINVRDSIVIHECDSIIYIPRETSNNTTEEQTSHVETSMAYSDACVDSLGRLHHSITNKEGVKERTKSKTITITKDSLIDRPYPIYIDHPVPTELTRIQKVEIKIGEITIMAILAFLIISVTRLYRRGMVAAIVRFVRGLFK